MLSPALKYSRGDNAGARRAASRLLAVPILGHIGSVASSAHLVRGNSALLMGDAESAIPDFEASGDAKNQTVAALARIGLAGALHRSSRDPERALAMLESVLEAGWQPTASEKLLHAHLLLSVGEVEKADATFAEARAMQRVADAHAAELREKSEREYVARRATVAAG